MIEKAFRKYDKDKSGEITYKEMRAAWIDLCDAEAELRKLDMTPFTGWGRNKVNRMRLSAAVEAQEKAMLKGFNGVRGTIEDFRKEQRLRRGVDSLIIPLSLISHLKQTLEKGRKPRSSEVTRLRRSEILPFETRSA